MLGARRAASSRGRRWRRGGRRRRAARGSRASCSRDRPRGRPAGCQGRRRARRRVATTRRSSAAYVMSAPAKCTATRSGELVGAVANPARDVHARSDRCARLSPARRARKGLSDPSRSRHISRSPWQHQRSATAVPVEPFKGSDGRSSGRRRSRCRPADLVGVLHHGPLGRESASGRLLIGIGTRLGDHPPRRAAPPGRAAGGSLATASCLVGFAAPRAPATRAPRPAGRRR